jgi:hypothetical protein
MFLLTAQLREEDGDDVLVRRSNREDGGRNFKIVYVVFVCPCRSNAEHRGLLSEVSMVMCVDVASDQPTDRTSSTQS